MLSIAITGLINKIFYKALNRLFWSYWGYDLDVFQNIFIDLFFYQNGQFEMRRYHWNFSSLSNVSEWFTPPLNARIFNDILDDAMQACQSMWTVMKQKIEQNTSAIWFCKVQLLLLDILLSLSLVYSLLKLNFKIHSFFTNIFNLRYNWEKHHKSKSYL